MKSYISSVSFDEKLGASPRSGKEMLVVRSKSFVNAMLVLAVLFILTGSAMAEGNMIFELTFDGTLQSSSGLEPLAEDEFNNAVVDTKFRNATGDETMVWSELNPTFVDGKQGQGLFVDEGVSALVYDVTDIGSFQQGTIELWFKPFWSRTIGGKHCVVFWLGSEEWVNDLRFWAWKQQNTAAMAHYEERRASATKGFEWEEGNWYHVAVTWRRGSVEYYINGERIANEMGIGPVGDRFYLSIGHVRSISLADGVIDEFRIYDYVKTADEINASYQSQL